MSSSEAELLFSNLLSNAIKYSMPNSTITLTLQDNRFSIKDEGVGIAAEKIKTIFELYNRSSTIAGGFGVGLSIVKQICDAHGISINVQSLEHKGTEFQLHLSQL